MQLTLSIENETALADGGPLTFTVNGKRDFEFGRHPHLDWTLPDPGLHISGKHCEVRFRDNAYWLYDVSTNGTYLNGDLRRLSEPHRLRHGDWLTIGHYLVRVALIETRPELQPEPAASAGPAGDDVWSDDEKAVPTLPPPAGLAPLPIDNAMWDGDDAHRPSPEPPSRRFTDADSWGDEREAPPSPVRLPPALGEVAWDDNHTQRVSSPASLVSPPSSPPTSQNLQSREPRQAPVPPPPMETGDATSERPVDDDGRVFVRTFATAAGIPEQALAHHDDASLARLLGGLVHLAAEDVRQLLAARTKAKALARSSNQTQFLASDNNPLKFSLNVEDALRLMFGPPSAGYLDAPRTLKASFADIKMHQVETYSAMQAALLELTDDFDPKKIDAGISRDGALGNLVGSRKARAWDIYVARWEAKTLRKDNGILGAFLEYFSKNYDRGK